MLMCRVIAEIYGGGVKHVDVPSDSRDLWGGGSNMLMCRVIAEIYSRGGGQTC